MESAAGQVPPTGEPAPGLRAAAQDAKIEALDLLVADLIAQTGRDSQNSSKPPSSDGPGTRGGPAPGAAGAA